MINTARKTIRIWFFRAPLFMEMRESSMSQKNRLRDKQINVRVTDYVMNMH